MSSDSLAPEPPRRWGHAVRLPELAPAIMAAQQLLRALTQPGRRRGPSPLVLHGPPGVGKTLVLTSLIQKLTQHPAGLTARILAAREWSPDDWPELVTVDLVGLDDLQHLPDRANGDLERLLDARHHHRRPTVITASQGPANLRLPHRLASRLGAGLVIAIPAFRPASRRLLIDLHARRRRLALDDSALDWLADQPTGGGVRPALGYVERLAVLARGATDPLSAATARQLLHDAPPEDANEPSPAELVIRRVAAVFGISVRDLMSPSRLTTTRLARQVAMTLTRELLRVSLPKIGQVFGGRDHTTVLHACRQVEAKCQADPAFGQLVEQLRRELR